MSKKVRPTLTPLEATQLYLAANRHAEALRTRAPGESLGQSPAEVAAFWRAIAKLQRARAEADA